MSNTIKSYRDLKVWNLGMDLAVELYEMTKSFPVEERYGLTAQVRKSAVSVPSNIAEGHARRTTGDYKRFLSFSQGSLAEMETQVILADRLDFLPSPQANSFLNRTDELGRMMSGLVNKLKS